jgi:hypothetical protein
MAQPLRKPTFLWQGLLIVLPVAVLAVVGAWSLRQDKALARQEAADRAQALAEDLVPKLWAEITAVTETDQQGYHAFEVDSAGKLLFPPPYSPTPRPLNPTGLTLEQARLWLAAQRAEAGRQDPQAVLNAYSAFVVSSPPSNFTATAQFASGLLLTQQGDRTQAADRFELVLEQYPDAVGESGLPLGPLAQLKLNELKKIWPTVPFGGAKVGAGAASPSFLLRLLACPGHADGFRQEEDHHRRRAAVLEEPQTALGRPVAAGRRCD